MRRLDDAMQKIDAHKKVLAPASKGEIMKVKAKKFGKECENSTNPLFLKRLSAKFQAKQELKLAKFLKQINSESIETFERSTMQVLALKDEHPTQFYDEFVKMNLCQQERNLKLDPSDIELPNFDEDEKCDPDKKEEVCDIKLQV